MPAAVATEHRRGFQDCETTSDPAIWYEANRLMGWDLFWIGFQAFAMVAGTSLFRRSMRFSTIATVHVTVLMVSMLSGFAHGFWRLTHL